MVKGFGAKNSLCFRSDVLGKSQVSTQARRQVDIQGKPCSRVKAFRDLGKEDEDSTGNVEFHVGITGWE